MGFFFLILINVAWAADPVWHQGIFPGTISAASCEGLYADLKGIASGPHSIRVKAPSKEWEGGVFVTASSIERARFTESKIQPDIDSWAAGLTQPQGPLGYWGPLGPCGPLQEFGVIGEHCWNPSKFITGKFAPVGFNFKNMVKAIMGKDGPASENGPLGKTWYEKILPTFIAYGSHLQAGGLFGILGPKGVLGVFSAIGEFGPIGAIGKIADKNGAYREGGSIVKSAKFKKGSKTKETELVEFYDLGEERRFHKKGKHFDESFVADGTIGKNLREEFMIDLKKDTWVNILPIPDSVLDSFGVKVFTSDGKLLLESNSRDLINFAQLKVPSNTTVKVQVFWEGGSVYDLSGGAFRRGGSYRLHVIEAPGEPRELPIDGPHLTRLF